MPAQSLLTGIPRAHRGGQKLRTIYKRSLLLLQKMPREASYRISTEAILSHRMSVLEEASDDVNEIEDNLGCGKIEQLISQAVAEYSLLQKMLVWKPWEKLVERPPQGQWDWPPAKV